MSDEEKRLEEDVEGHKRMKESADDTEGHIKPRKEDLSGDDTEGHIKPRKEDLSGDDTEGHIKPRK
jgi:hypothetical protein